jgi:hypothetical protein
LKPVSDGWEGFGTNEKAGQKKAKTLISRAYFSLRGQDLNLRPSGYEGDNGKV